MIDPSAVRSYERAAVQALAVRPSSITAIALNRRARSGGAGVTGAVALPGTPEGTYPRRGSISTSSGRFRIVRFISTMAKDDSPPIFEIQVARSLCVTRTVLIT